MSLAAFEAATQLAIPGRYLWQEYLAVKGRAAAGKAAGGAAGHWTAGEGERRLAEVRGRMLGGAD